MTRLSQWVFRRVHHKIICYSQAVKGMGKLVEKLIISPLVNVYVMLALGHEFRLRESTREERVRIARQPLHAELDIIVEPQDLAQL